MSERLSARYRLLLSLYPASFLERRGEELVTTLLECAEPGQEWPTVQEASSLFFGAMHARWSEACLSEEAGPTARAICLQGIEASAFLMGLVALFVALSPLASAIWWLSNHSWNLQGSLPAQLSHAILWSMGCLVAIAVTTSLSKPKRFFGLGVLALLLVAHFVSPPLQRAFPLVTASHPTLALLITFMGVIQTLPQTQARLFQRRGAIALMAALFFCGVLSVRWAVDYHSGLVIARTAAFAALPFFLAWAALDPRIAVAMSALVVGWLPIAAMNWQPIRTLLLAAIACAACVVSALRVRYAVRRYS